MRHLLLLITILYTIGASSQTITNKKGQTFDLEQVESGSYIEYNFKQQGILVWRFITVDGVRVFKFSNPKKTEMIINGKRQYLGKDVSIAMLKFFTQQGCEVLEKEESTTTTGVNLNSGQVYSRRTNNLLVIKS